VSEGHTYSYEIRAVQPIGDSAYSDPAVATTLAVQGLVATAASGTGKGVISHSSNIIINSDP
ncbi:MAG: hypothetical protein JWP03_3612, partial [Phycisphaerales bacterium]|nr:hypothetical protein [Phycisphaerales bacterium]